MSSRPNSNKAGCFFAVLFLIFVAIVWTSNHSGQVSSTTPMVQRAAPVRQTPVQPVRNPLLDALRPPAVERVDGVGIALLVDTSGSMNSAPRSAPGEVKIISARRSAMAVIRKVEDYAKANPDKKVRLGIYEFSSRPNEPSCRTVSPLLAPDSAAAQARIEAMVPNGNTPMGDAILYAKRDLDASGLTRQHIVVVTDGESNQGYSPADVLGAISRMDSDWQAAVYFVAFDVNADVFKPLREAGGLVLTAANAQELQSTLDYILSGKILVEQPATPQ